MKPILVDETLAIDPASARSIEILAQQVAALAMRNVAYQGRTQLRSEKTLPDAASELVAIMGMWDMGEKSLAIEALLDLQALLLELVYDQLGERPVDWENKYRRN